MRWRKRDRVLSSGNRKSLIEVDEDVIKVLNANAQAQQIRRDAGTEGFEFHDWLEGRRQTSGWRDNLKILRITHAGWTPSGDRARQLRRRWHRPARQTKEHLPARP